jgi:hypothetical protein
MATDYKVLGQSAPSATTDTDLFTVPAGRQAVVSTLSIANRGSGPASFRLAVRPGGATLANQHYLVFDAPIAGNDLVALTIGITLDATDVLTVFASSANMSFSAFGSEVTL